LKEKNEEYLRLIEELKYAKLKKEESESKHKFLFDCVRVYLKNPMFLYPYFDYINETNIMQNL
jgi:hypothetical protein